MSTQKRNISVAWAGSVKFGSGVSASTCGQHNEVQLQAVDKK